MDRQEIWIIDDEFDLAESYADILKDSYRVRCFERAQDVLNALTDDQVPDLFVTDINMPGMSGIELITELRKRNIGKPVVIVSGYAEKDHAVRALELGVSGLIEKPFMRVHFRHTVNRAISHAITLEMNAALIERSLELIAAMGSLVEKCRDRYLIAENQLDPRGGLPIPPLSKEECHHILQYVRDIVSESRLEELVRRSKLDIEAILKKRDELRSLSFSTVCEQQSP